MKKAENRVFFTAFIAAAVFCLAGGAQAADCGGATTCNCGDTVTTAYVVATDLNCTTTFSLTVQADLNLYAGISSTGNGLVVGANGITIDGNGYTLVGDGGSSDYGIVNSGGYDNLNIKNFSNIANFNKGLSFSSCTGSTIQNITVSSNSYGVLMSSSSSNTLADNTLADNTSYGLWLSYSSSYTMTGNTFSGNPANFYVYGSNTSQYYHNIDTTNTVEGMPIYYFYNNFGTAESPVVYDGNVVGDIGLFWCIDCNYVTVKNAVFPEKNYYNVFFYGTKNSTIQNTIASSSVSNGIYLSSSNSNDLNGNVASSNGTSGISLSSSNSNSITNNTANSNTNGIYLTASSDNNLTNNTVNSNEGYGLYIGSSSDNNLTNNTANSNINGIYYLGASSSILAGNTTNSNEGYGVYLTSSAPNTLTGNTMTGNTTNLNIYGTSADKYENTVSTTNTVEGKPVYYFYGQSNETYDGDSVGEIGMFWCISCTNVTVKNTTLSASNHAGIYFNGTTGSSAQNITANSNIYGIYLDSSSTDNNLTNNTANSNTYGIYLNSASNNNLAGNTVKNSGNDIYNTGTVNQYSSNQFSHNINSKMLVFTDAARAKNINDTITINASMSDAGGAACSTCTYAIASSPNETVTTIETDNNISGSFIATRPGTYSLIFTITDSNNNSTKRRILFLVDSTGSQTTTYYLRETVPSQGQPKGTDARSLLFAAPASAETWTCNNWIQNALDGIPHYPLANLSSIETNSWYKQSMASGAYMGVQRNTTYDKLSDSNISVPSATDYTQINKEFTDLNWGMDYPQSWYRISLKLFGTSPYIATFPAGQPDQPSYANFTYSYATTPAIKSISDANIVVLSATASASDTNNIQIVLDGYGSTSIVVGGKRPFLDYVTDINSDGNATIFATNLRGETDINSVAMDLWPSIGDINISVMAWNTDGNYYKKWAETGSEAGITAEHIIGNLAASANYTVKVDGAEFGSYQSDSSGLISFTYDGGYSEKIFEVQDTTAPTTISNDYNSGWNTIDQNIQFSCSDPASGCKNFYYAIDDANYQQAWDSDNNIGIAITIDGNHSIFYWSSDNADNNETAHITYAALDKDEPTITITSPPNGHTQKSTTITLHYTATDTNSGIAKYYIKADTGSWIDNNTNTSYAFTGQSTTTHTYQAKAVNNAGNEATATITTTIEPTNNTASGTPGGNTGTPTPTGTTTLFETETTATPSQQEIQATLSEAGFTQEQINAAMQIAQKTPTTQTATGMKTISMSGTAYRTSITITITNNSANKWREIKVIAEIPKNIAESTAPIDSNNTFSVLKEDPIIQFALPEIQTGETAEIEYTIAKNISETEAKTLPQPIIASYQETQPCDNVECENTPCATGKCNNTTGKCEYEYAADGTNCGLNKTCQSGTCLQTQQPPSGPGTQEPPAQQVEPDYIAPAMAAAAAILIIAAAGYYFARKRK